MYKMVKDWRGFDHKSKGEFETLIWIIIISSTVYIFWNQPQTVSDYILLYCKSAVVQMTGYQLFFPYLINWRMSHLYGYGPESRIEAIFKHLSDVAVPDHWPAYQWLRWYGRLILWLTCFGLSLYFFYL